MGREVERGSSDGGKENWREFGIPQCDNSVQNGGGKEEKVVEGVNGKTEEEEDELEDGDGDGGGGDGGAAVRRRRRQWLEDGGVAVTMVKYPWPGQGVAAVVAAGAAAWRRAAAAATTVGLFPGLP